MLRFAVTFAASAALVALAIGAAALTEVIEDLAKDGHERDGGVA